MEWNQKQNKRNKVSDCDYEKYFMKIKFSSDDDLPLNKPLKCHAMTIIIRSVFDLFFQIMLCMKYKTVEHDRIDFSEGNDVNQTSASKECDICQYYYFKDMAIKYETYLYNGCHDLMQKSYEF